MHAKTCAMSVSHRHMTDGVGVSDGVMRLAHSCWSITCSNNFASGIYGNQFSRTHCSGCLLPLWLHPSEQGQQEEVTTAAVCGMLDCRPSRFLQDSLQSLSAACISTFSMLGR